MNGLKFWQHWHPTSRNVYIFLLGTFVLVSAAFAIIYPQGISNIVSWERISELKEVPVTQEPISVGLFSFSYELPYSVLSETFIGSSLQLSHWAASILLIIVAVSWIMLLTILSALERFWYYVGVLLLLGLILLFQLEQLLWFGQTQKFGILIAFGLFLLPTAFFQLARPDASLLTRLTAFGGATAIFGIMVGTLTEVPMPFLTLAYHSVWVPIILTIIFIIIVGHELISFFVKIITQNNTNQSSNSLIHILVLSAIYLINLTLVFLKNIGTIDWDIIYLDAFWLLVVLGAVGIWGFKDREGQYKNIIPFAPLGAIFYLSLGAVSVTTVVFLSWQGNDPLLESLEDTIIYTQIGFSAIFLIYLIANFIDPLLKNQRVYAILYRPMTFPYGTVLIMGTIVTVALFARGGFFSYSQLLSGYYIGIGDLHWMKNDLFVAEQFYKLSDQYANNNHRANYSLGALARQQDDPVLNAYYFQEALQKKPSPEAYSNAGAAYVKTNQYFDALFTMKEGVAAFPNNPYLFNNLGMLYGRTNVVDSALFWLTKAQDNASVASAAEANMLALIGQKRNQIGISTDSLLNEFYLKRDYDPATINSLLLQGQAPADSIEILQPNIPEDSTLDASSFAQIKNFLLQASWGDSSFLGDVEVLSDLAQNFPYTEELILAVAITQYRQNKVVDALRKLDRLQSVNVFKRSYYLDIIGLWALEQRTPRVATQYFAQLAEKDYHDAKVKFAVSLSESLQSSDVTLGLIQQAWRDVRQDSTLESFHEMAEQQLRVLNTAISQTESDTELYQWFRYRGPELTDNELTEAFQSFEDPNYATVAAYELLLSDRKLTKILAPIIQELRIKEAALNYQGTIFLEWAWALSTISTQNVTEWKSRIDMLVPLTKQQNYQKTLWQAQLAQLSGNESEAQESYSYLLGNPFFEPGLIGALHYFYADQPEEIYRFFLDAIQTNPYSTALLEEYILSAVRVGLENYAEESLADLKQLAKDSHYQEFLQRYQLTKDKQEVAF